MVLAWRIIGVQGSPISGKAIYTLLLGKERTARILTDRRESWQVDMIVQLEESFVRENEQPWIV
jgi:hypothetical protein